jgi:glycosyltransferase
MKLSVVTATYNCAETLADCLDSVAGQTHGDVEHIVIDGASSDGTLDLLRSRRAGLAQLVSEPDGGIYFGLNKGKTLASDEVVGFLHGDDVYAHREILAGVAAAFAHPAVQCQ